MSRRKNRFAGKSISDIMEMSIDEFLNLSGTEIRQATQRLASAANKRLKRLSSSNVVSPAQMEAEESGGKFSTAHKNLLQLQVEFRRVSNFLQSKSSTVTGAKQLEAEARKALNDIYGVGIDASEFNAVVRNFRTLLNSSPEIQAKALKYNILKDIRVELDDNNLTTDEIAEKVKNTLMRYYQPGGAQYDGFADYFGLT